MTQTPLFLRDAMRLSTEQTMIRAILTKSQNRQIQNLLSAKVLAVGQKVMVHLSPNQKAEHQIVLFRCNKKA